MVTTPNMKATQIARVLITLLALSLMLLWTVIAPSAAHAGKKKDAKTDEAAKPEVKKPEVDISKLVWPEPPNVPRVRYLNYFAGMKIPTAAEEKENKTAKQSWMDRLAGVAPEQQKGQKMLPFQLLGPYMMATDSKGSLYVGDYKVGAIFIFNVEDKYNVQMIRNGVEAHFSWINGLAIDDDDRLFVADGKLHHVLVFNAKHEATDQIASGLVDPVGVAIDKENRLLYVVDTQQDQVFVFDADSFRLIRRMGTPNKKHESTAPGDFALPTGVAVDSDGNVFVTDTMNSRIEMFDADGKFIRQFGQNCDGPGCTPKPKGIATDSDGHVWVADAMIDVLQIFTNEGVLAGYVGGHGKLPGQFSSLAGVAIDKDNRVFAADQYPGRVQMFRYTTDVEAAKLQKEKEEKVETQRAARSATARPPATDAVPQTVPKQ
jgi:sugar lactone lactonase YvrE